MLQLHWFFWFSSAWGKCKALQLPLCKILGVLCHFISSSLCPPCIIFQSEIPESFGSLFTTLLGSPYFLICKQCWNPLREVHVVIFVADFTTSANHHMYLWWFPPQVQITTNTCGSFHHKCKSPQVFIVILFEVGSKVREHYECIVDGGNMFNSMCPWYLVCNTGTFSDWENTNQKRWNDMRSINTGKGMQSNCLNQQTRHMAPHVDSQWCHTAHCHEKDMSNQQQP